MERVGEKVIGKCACDIAFVYMQRRSGCYDFA